jgi:hypothetical protein
MTILLIQDLDWAQVDGTRLWTVDVIKGGLYVDQRGIYVGISPTIFPSNAGGSQNCSVLAARLSDHRVGFSGCALLRAAFWCA